MAVYPHLDTASQRPATGLDPGARQLMMRVVEDLISARQGSVPPPQLMIGCLFHDRYGGQQDYMRAVGAVWGEPVRFQLARAVDEAQAVAEFGLSFSSRAHAGTVGLIVLLTHMPEPDFRLAVEETLRYINALEEGAERLNSICMARGIPWRVEPVRGFEWIGDQTVEREVMAPSLSALNDRRFVGGVRVEFEQARVELKAGTPQARKQVLTEASCAVESAMKVVLIERGIGHDQRDAAQKLWERLRDAGLLAADSEFMLLAVPRARNKRGAHGAGSVAHDVQQHEAEGFVAAAAVAISFLGKLLP